jgi:hypothetical protein
LPQRAAEFERSLTVLRDGDLERPLFVPWDDAVRQRFAVVEDDWSRFARRWILAPPAVTNGLRGDTASFAADIDALVAGIERHMSRWTALLHLLQIAMMAFAIVGAAVLVYTRLSVRVGALGAGDWACRLGAECVLTVATDAVPLSRRNRQHATSAPRRAYQRHVPSTQLT